MRAQDMHLVARVFPEQRQVLLTGSIDTNDFNINVVMKLPDSGTWTIIKAETNLTNESWTSWVMRLGEGTSIPKDSTKQTLYSRQFEKAKYYSEYNSIVFGKGEVRPGEPVLKIYSVELQGQIYSLAHGNRNPPASMVDTTNLDSIMDFNIKNNIPAQEDVIIPTIISHIDNNLISDYNVKYNFA